MSPGLNLSRGSNSLNSASEVRTIVLWISESSIKLHLMQIYGLISFRFVITRWPYPTGITIIERVSIRKTFAQFLRNETQNFSFFVHQFCVKKQQFAQSFAKVISRKIAIFRFCENQICEILQLVFCAITQFRKNQTVGDCVCFLEFNSSSAGRFCTEIRNRLSSKSLDNFSFGFA